MGNMEAEERKEEGTPSGETLEAAFGKLDQMLETLESSDVSLEDSFRLYKEGMELLNECSQKIDRVEKKMLQMNPDKLFCTKRRLLAFCHFGKVRVIQPTVEQCLRLFDDFTEQNLFGFIEREDLLLALGAQPSSSR